MAKVVRAVRPGLRSRTAPPWAGLSGALGNGPVRRVELKMALDDSQDFTRLAGRLGLNAAKVNSLRVYFIDDRGHTLRRHGMTIRLREYERSVELGLKLRNTSPIELPAGLHGLSGLSHELDALPGRNQWSLALKNSQAKPRSCATSDGSWLDWCSPEQRQFLAAVTRRQGHTRYDTSYGPIQVHRLDGSAAGLSRLVLERWRLPDGRQLLELSTKCRSQDAKATARVMRDLVRRRRIAPSARQRTKTEEFLQAWAPAGATAPSARAG